MAWGRILTGPRRPPLVRCRYRIGKQHGRRNLRDFPRSPGSGRWVMGRNAVGFYWTLPVSWAGVVKLPKDVDRAAKLSKTIRYQRDRIRSYAANNGYRLLHEEVFIELNPDRGSDYILDSLGKVEALCKTQVAMLMFVSFKD